MHAHPTLQIIRDEHAALSAVLRSLVLLVNEQRRRHAAPNYEVLRAMLFYIDEFPERLHHPKETQLLFPKLRARSPAVAAVLDRLDADHRHSERAILALEHDLLALEMTSESPAFDERRRRFEDGLEAYVLSYLDHMRVEEEQVLPAAERLLSPDEWVELDAAFMTNRDPLTRRAGDDEFRPLFKRILMTLPAPLGLGPAIEAMRASYREVAPT